MEWNIVKIGQTSGKSVPFVSIGRGQLDFNAVACELVHDDGKTYRYAQLLQGKENGKQVVAVKFLKEPEDNIIPIKRKTQNGRIIKGMTIVNKGVIGELFGKDGKNDGMRRYSVKLIDYNILQIIG